MVLEWLPWRPVINLSASKAKPCALPSSPNTHLAVCIPASPPRNSKHLKINDSSSDKTEAIANSSEISFHFFSLKNCTGTSSLKTASCSHDEWSPTPTPRPHPSPLHHITLGRTTHTEHTPCVVLFLASRPVEDLGWQWPHSTLFPFLSVRWHARAESNPSLCYIAKPKLFSPSLTVEGMVEWRNRDLCVRVIFQQKLTNFRFRPWNESSQIKRSY